jgi:hypothetical protein
VLLICSVTVIYQKWGHVGETRTTASSLTLIQPNQDNPAKLPLIFKWKPVEGADYYALEIFDETLVPVWKCAEIRSPYFAMPAVSSGWLKFNKPYFWMTIAYRNKEKLAESDLARFVVTLKDH